MWVNLGGLCAMSHLPPPPPNSSLAPVKEQIGVYETSIVSIFLL